MGDGDEIYILNEKEVDLVGGKKIPNNKSSS